MEFRNFDAYEYKYGHYFFKAMQYMHTANVT